MTRYEKPGRFGHVSMVGICGCPRSTIDSSNIVTEPISCSNGGLWLMVYCTACGGTGAVNVSCDQAVLETFDYRHVPSVVLLWQNPIPEPPPY